LWSWTRCYTSGSFSLEVARVPIHLDTTKAEAGPKVKKTLMPEDTQDQVRMDVTKAEGGYHPTIAAGVKDRNIEVESVHMTGASKGEMSGQHYKFISHTTADTPVFYIAPETDMYNYSNPNSEPATATNGNDVDVKVHTSHDQCTLAEEGDEEIYCEPIVIAPGFQPVTMHMDFKTITNSSLVLLDHNYCIADYSLATLKEDVPLQTVGSGMSIGESSYRKQGLVKCPERKLNSTEGSSEMELTKINTSTGCGLCLWPGERSVSFGGVILSACQEPTSHSGNEGSNNAVQHVGVKFCEYTIEYKSEVSLHVAVKHEGKRYNCEICEYTAGYKRDLTQHMAVEHESKGYSCTLCEYTTGYKVYLDRHVVVQHEKKMKRRKRKKKNW
jgi:hypothetical protein